MKRKTNISVQDNRGIRVTPRMIVGEEFNGFVSGDILDANAIVSLIIKIAGEGGGQVLPNSITSDEIKDGTIRKEDLADDVADKLESVYKENEQSLYIDGSGKNNQ